MDVRTASAAPRSCAASSGEPLGRRDGRGDLQRVGDPVAVADLVRRGDAVLEQRAGLVDGAEVELDAGEPAQRRRLLPALVDLACERERGAEHAVRLGEVAVAELDDAEVRRRDRPVALLAGSRR